MVNLTLPVPQTFFEVIWIGIGITFARGFGKQCDYKIQQSDWFKRRTKLQQWFIESLLNFLHHWWIGAIMMIYLTQYQEAYWFGLGLLLDDLPDIPQRIKKLLGWMFN